MIDFDSPPLRDVLPILRRGLNVKHLPAPRAFKSPDEKNLRTRQIAEVFTPSKIVKFMVDAIDDANPDSRWLELACGEAPFITTRYDAESGEFIPAQSRAGILDRKLRRAKNKSEALRAVQTVYGCELQADSLLLARANVLLSVAEFVEDCSLGELRELAEIIAQNFWQTDILNPPPRQINLFEDVTDWQSGDKFLLGGSDMKFDFVIGNPPYQGDTKGDNKKFAPPVYDKFMEAAFKVGKRVELITPARFLFNAGATPKDFNRRMLNDTHLKVLDYASDTSKYFKGVNIEGGVAITLRDETKNFGAIGTFIPWGELRSICDKVTGHCDFAEFGQIVSGRTPYLFTEEMHAAHPAAKDKLSSGHPYDIASNAFEVLPEIFTAKPSGDSFRILGRLGSERAYRWIKREYVRGRVDYYIGKRKVFLPKANGAVSLGKWKTFLPNANGASGKLSAEPSRIIGKPALGEPDDICTDTFLVVGAFDTHDEATACLAYVKSKFVRCLLGALKVTPVNPKATWAKVPLQNFTAGSDIDWQGDVDAQLYKKYGLEASEIEFIEAHVKDMD